MNFFAILNFINVNLAIFLGIDVRSKDPYNKLNQMFFVTSMMGAYTTACEFFKLTASSEYWAYFWNKVSFVWPFFPFMFLGMILQIADKTAIEKKSPKFLFVLPALLISVLHLSTDILYERPTYSWYGWKLNNTHSVFSLIVPIYFVATSFISLLIVIRYLRAKNKKSEKRKAIFALIALAIPTLSGFITKEMVPRLGIDIPPLNPLFYIIGTVFLYINIFRYKFLNLDPNDTVKKLFETSVDYMVIYNKRGNIILASNSVLEAVDCDQSEIVEKNISNIFHRFHDSVKLNRSDAPGKEIELFLKAKDYSNIPTSVIITKVESETRKESLFFLTARDLRERKQFEEELVSMQKSLEEKVINRTSDLSKALTEKETLLKEVHHRVKNNLQIISSILFLQSKNITDNKTREIFYECQNRVKAMALVHQHLYQSADLSQINFPNYIRNLTDVILSTYALAKKPHISFDLDETILSIDVTISLGLILQELISNTLKYAFPESQTTNNDNDSNIWITFKIVSEKNYYLSLEDNGIGLEKSFSLEASNTLGLKLVNAMLQQINGSLSFSSNGTTKFEIHFSEN